MIRSPLVGEESDVHLKNIGMRGLDLTTDEARELNQLAMTPTSNAWPSPSPASSSSPPVRGSQWSPRFHGSPRLPEEAALRGMPAPGGVHGASNWHVQAPGAYLSTPVSTALAAGARMSPTPVVPGTMAPSMPSAHHMLPMGQGLPALPQMYSSYFDQMECRDANSSAAAAAVLGWPYSQLYYSYDPMLGQVGGYSTDMTAGRRKNATRETTSTLKAWLKEHKKNPYPTKGEKIMLAIISKMTLTQVSTWFANARRRLKKENKMMWDSSNNVNGNLQANAGANDDSDADERSSEKSNSAPPVAEFEESRLAGNLLQPGSGRLLLMQDREEEAPKNSRLVSFATTKIGLNGETKPKIWSIVDTVVRNPPEAAIPSSSSTPNGGTRTASKRRRDEDDEDDESSPIRKARRFEADLPSDVAGAGPVTAGSLPLLQHHHRVTSPISDNASSSPAGIESAAGPGVAETPCDNPHRSTSS